MPQTKKIQGKFYPLTSEVTAKLRQAKLTAAEWRIWSYLVEVDPWGDRYQDLDSLNVMSKCDCSKATFYRAIAKFQRLGLFDIQDKGFNIRNLTGASTIKSVDEKIGEQRLRKGYLKTAKVVSKMRLDSQNCESSLKNETGFSKMRLNSQICDNQPPETPPDKAFKSPQTIQTYTNFKKTLSEDERDNFLNFVREQIRNLEKPINDLEAWLASKNAANQNRWEVYYKNYQDQKGEQKPRNSQKTSSEGNFDADEKSAIARWQKRLKEQAEASEAALRKSNPFLNKTNPTVEPENSVSDDLNGSEGTATEKSHKSSPDVIKSEFDQILGNSAGFTKDTSSSPEPSPSPKITKEEGLDFLRNLGMMKHFEQDLNQEQEENQDPDLGGEEDE